jgi:hypothetical protein
MTEVVLPSRGMAAPPPGIAGAPFLTDPSFVLAPNLEVRCLGVGLGNLLETLGEALFLKASCARGSACG